MDKQHISPAPRQQSAMQPDTAAGLQPAQQQAKERRSEKSKTKKKKQQSAGESRGQARKVDPNIDYRNCTDSMSQERRRYAQRAEERAAETKIEVHVTHAFEMRYGGRQEDKRQKSLPESRKYINCTYLPALKYCRTRGGQCSLLFLPVRDPDPRLTKMCTTLEARDTRKIDINLLPANSIVCGKNSASCPFFSSPAGSLSYTYN